MIFKVTTLLDEFVQNSDLSLREAIAAANAQPGKDEIVFDPLIYDKFGENKILLTLGELQITESVVINGDLSNDGIPDITIDAQNNSRVFKISDGDPLESGGIIDQNVLLNGLIITGGNATGELANASGLGGGIFTTENLTVRHSVIIDNFASEVGGGISGFSFGSTTLATGPITVESSVVTGNGGGGIFAYDGLTISNSTISNNTATDRSFVVAGILGGSKTVVKNSTISGNSGGSGLWSYGELSVSNSTISGNSDPGNGGGIYAYGPIDIRNSTIVKNSSGGFGGGIASRFSSFQGDTKLTSTIVAGNISSNGADIALNIADDLADGLLTSGGFNLIGNGNDIDGFIASDIVGTETAPIDPKLGSLENNGGFTDTHALLPGSLAIDAGSNSNNSGFDQRGPGFARFIGEGVDIGAFESNLMANDIEFRLVDADANRLITTIKNGTQILVSDLVNKNVTITAFIPNDSQFSGRVESIHFDLNDGQIIKTENLEPYALLGDDNGDLNGVPDLFNVGMNTIQVSLFSEDNLTGEELATANRNFTLVNDLNHESTLEVGLHNASTADLIAPTLNSKSISANSSDDNQLTVNAYVPDASQFSGQADGHRMNLDDREIINTEYIQPRALFVNNISGDL